jgi:hypothetical protein
VTQLVVEGDHLASPLFGYVRALYTFLLDAPKTQVVVELLKLDKFANVMFKQQLQFFVGFLVLGDLFEV